MAARGGCTPRAPGEGRTCSLEHACHRWMFGGSTARQRALSDLGDNGVVIHVSTSRVANVVISCIIELCRKGTLLGREGEGGWGGGGGGC